MRKGGRNDGWTLLETLIVMGIVVCVFIVLLPAIQASREAARRVTCHNNLKQIGLGIHNYAQVYKLFPASAGVTRDAAGKITAITGPSLLVAILPYMDGAKQGGVGPGARYAPLLCPSYDGSPWADPATQKEAITNYRPLGATHIESLSVASPNPLTPKYADAKSPHPDGICFPGSYSRYGRILRGLSNTFLVAESLEPRFSRWAVGADAAMVGLPRNVEFESVEGNWFYACPKGYYAALKGDDNSIYWTYRTYLDWDYDQSPYDGVDGNQWGKYGPSSNHANVVMHLIADGSPTGISRAVDITFYSCCIIGH